MLSPTEALRLEITIARLATEYVAARDIGQKAQLLTSIKSLSDKREEADQATADAGSATLALTEGF
jgi:hypothetical protein